ncbi:MAG: hypothetical protein IIU70_03650 [Anaerotignum sp.]|nr:hypothetical protein [Anaerotignum sp.]
MNDPPKMVYRSTEAAGEWTGTVTVCKGEESLSKEAAVLTKDHEEL